MSALVITMLIVGGIALLMVIAYINHAVENSKLEKARQRADLLDRIRRCQDISERMPGQLMTPQLKLLLSQLQLQVSEAKAKDVRFLLENLHALITGSVQAGLLPAGDGKHWLKQIRQMLVLVHIEFFSTLGQTAMQQNQPGQARLAFERGVQYLRKQPDPTPYQTQLKRFEEQLARANAMVLNNSVPNADEPSQLTEGLKDLEDDWKKKNIYD